MLARQQCGRYDQRHLVALQGRDKGGAQRDFGLAEPDIAADQPIHRATRGKVAQDILDGPLLVVGFCPFEAGGEFVIGAVGRVKRHALA